MIEQLPGGYRKEPDIKTPQQVQTALQSLGLHSQITTVTTKCRKCKEIFSTQQVKLSSGERIVLVDVDCPMCRKPEQETPYVRPKRDFEAEWAQICPQQFLTTDPNKIPEVIRAEFRKYRYSNFGLVATGPTGTFKSRTMYLLMRHLFFCGLRVKLLDGIKVGTMIGDSFETNGYGILLDNFTAVDVLLIDDFDKVKLTPRVEEGIFAVIDRRYHAGRPTFLTTNIEGKVLEQFYSPHIGPALRRRIAESCRQIQTGVLLEKWQEPREKNR